jgi:hypothetical protein
LLPNTKILCRGKLKNMQPMIAVNSFFVLRSAVRKGVVLKIIKAHFTGLRLRHQLSRSRSPL